ncbi:MAG: hypothetical protein AW09_001589 [Candidatus Accumulibacter phosphatis]|uniref:Uncharacterized protein n=1 Tax=Candidatus Accumulibacter phosphatis TaxID=327160 RepID=A0A080LYV4_9PROT|nr:MAG: hypothetical protein AW09_001589 [Candidatus Accumulibacter phosphatis]
MEAAVVGHQSAQLVEAPAQGLAEDQIIVFAEADKAALGGGRAVEQLAHRQHAPVVEGQLAIDRQPVGLLPEGDAHLAELGFLAKADALALRPVEHDRITEAMELFECAQGLLEVVEMPAPAVVAGECRALTDHRAGRSQLASEVTGAAQGATVALAEQGRTTLPRSELRAGVTSGVHIALEAEAAIESVQVQVRARVGDDRLGDAGAAADVGMDGQQRRYRSEPFEQARLGTLGDAEALRAENAGDLPVPDIELHQPDALRGLLDRQQRPVLGREGLDADQKVLATAHRRQRRQRAHQFDRGICGRVADDQGVTDGGQQGALGIDPINGPRVAAVPARFLLADDAGANLAILGRQVGEIFGGLGEPLQRHRPALAPAATLAALLLARFEQGVVLVQFEYPGHAQIGGLGRNAAGIGRLAAEPLERIEGDLPGCPGGQQIGHPDHAGGRIAKCRKGRGRALEAEGHQQGNGLVCIPVDPGLRRLLGTGRQDLQRVRCRALAKPVQCQEAE